MDTPGLGAVSTIFYVFLILASVLISVLGSIVMIAFLTRRKIDVKEEIVYNRNWGLALVLGSFIWTIGQMCLESVRPIMNVWYSNFASGFTLSSALSFAAGIIGALLNALLIGAITVYLSIKILMVIIKDVNEWEEIKQGNFAVAIVIAVTVIVVGMFFETIVSFLVASIFGF